MKWIHTTLINIVQSGFIQRWSTLYEVDSYNVDFQCCTSGFIQPWMKQIHTTLIFNINIVWSRFIQGWSMLYEAYSYNVDNQRFMMQQCTLLYWLKACIDNGGIIQNCFVQCWKINAVQSNVVLFNIDKASILYKFTSYNVFFNCCFTSDHQTFYTLF